MTSIKRLVTYTDVSHQASRERVSISARHELELANGSRVLLLSDRGWGSSGSWTEVTTIEIQRTARMVVGPDEPPEGRTHEEEANLHWTRLQTIAQQHGVIVDVDELRQLPHDVEISGLLLARIGHRPK